MADINQILELLRSFPFLADQPEDLLVQLAGDAQLLRFSLGQAISRADQPQAQLFFLLQGTARSVVMAQRLARGVATLQRLGPGAVFGWTALSCGTNRETLIASTDLVALALPHAALAGAMARHPSLAQRVQTSVNPAELFALLDAHLRDYPRALAKEVVQAATALADSCRAASLEPGQLATTQFPPERLWLVAGGGLPLGTVLPTALPVADPRPLRVIGIDRDGLARHLDPPS
ncbi:MAG: cyclic nucleotide-binding domain-containing protein, partial [Prochlorococcaceae cyanobacterium]